MLQIGCDLCRIAQLESMLKEEPATLEKIFNPEEHREALAHKRPAQRLAGIFAAKEALAKAIRQPSLLGKYYREVTVSHQADGRPALQLSPRLTDLLSSQGIFWVDLSISHDGEYALAAVLVEKRKLQCDLCLLPLTVLMERGIADRLLQVVSGEGKVSYRCPVCFRGW